jgi:CRP-like cAMP-binding protein
LTTPDASDVPRRNRILGALPAAELENVRTRAEVVELGLRETVYELDERIVDVHFPTRGVLSHVHVKRGGGAVEVAAIGNEGMGGLPVFLGADRYPGRCFSQVPDTAVRLSAEAFTELAEPGTALHALLLRYAHALMIQMGQNAACNRLHRVENRCARWILTTHDRVEDDEFPLTQEFLAQMLGVRRPSVSTAASALQRAGLIRYSRGRLTVLDREGLLDAGCECYAVIQEHTERLLPPP